MGALEPVRGLVLSFSYLWRWEHRQGLEDGAKDRPCIVFLVDETASPGSRLVSLVPITTKAPRPEQRPDVVPMNPDTQRRLGLGDVPAWIALADFNRFIWPGFDLRRTPDGRESYGLLPARQILALSALIDRRQSEACITPIERGG